MSTATKKIASVGLSLTTAIWLSGAAMIVPVAGAATADELQAQINQLLAQINNLNAQLSSAQGTSTGASAGTAACTFSRNLTMGSKGADVKCLQEFLNGAGYTIAESGAGSPGKETTTFGSLTKKAVAKWQSAEGLTPAVGYFGSLSRAKYTEVAVTTGGTTTGGTTTGGTTTGGTTVVTPTESYLKVEAAGPVATTIPDGSLYNSVLKLKLTAGKDEAKVTAVTVTRGGYVANTLISGVSAWDDAGTRYGNIVTSLTSDGKATLSFGSTPFTVAAGTSKTLTVAVSVDSTAGSGSISFSVVAATDVTVSGSVPVQGTFPIVSNVFTIVDGSSSLGDARINDQAVTGMSVTNAQNSAVDGNVEIGDTQKEVAKIRFAQNNSKEAIKLEKLTIYVGGTFEEAKDLKNWKLYSPEGNVLASADKSSDRYVVFSLATPYTIDKGLTKDLSVKVDVAEGSGRYFNIYIQNDYDVVIRGATTGAAIQIVDSTGGTFAAADTQGNITSAYFKMKAGALTVSKASGSPSGSVAPSSQNIVLAKFDVKSTGEQMEIRKIGLQIQYAAVALTGSITVKDATTGETYLSISADTTGIVTTTAPSAASLLTYQQNLSSYIALKSGETKSIEVVGTVSSNATSTSNYTANVGQFYVKRFSTNDFTTLATGPYQGNQITVTNVDLTVSNSSSFQNTKRSKSATNAKIAEFILQATAADDVKVNTLTLAVSSSSFIQNMKLIEGTTYDAAKQLGTTVGTPSTSGDSVTVNTTVTKSGSKTVSVFADILSSATSDATFSVSVSASGVSGYGVVSGKSLASVPASTVTGRTITVSTPTLTITKDSGAPISKIVLAGASGVELGRIRLEAKNEDLTLKKITLSLFTASSTQWTSTSSIAANFGNVYLYEITGGTVGSTAIGTASIVSGEAIVSGLNVTLPQDSQKILVVKANINGSGTLTPKSVGGIQVKASSTTDLEVFSSQGLMSTGVTLTDNASSSNFLFTDTAPTIAVETFTAGSVGSQQTVGKFKVTNSGTRPITISSTTITATLGGSYGSNATSSPVTTFKLYNEGDQVIATAAGSINGAAPTSTLTFSSLTSDAEIASGGSKVYTIKADTQGVRTGVASGSTVNLSVKIDGSKGYSASNATNEIFWNDGGVTYSYTSADSNSTSYTNLTASDSYPVEGTTITY